MRGVITAPKKIITGAFTVLFSFPKPVEMSRDAIEVETIEGDALGNPKDSFGGKNKHYHLLCYLPDARVGKSRLSVNLDGIIVTPVTLIYDTVRLVNVMWGEPFRRGNSIEIPFSFDVPIYRLRKSMFTFSIALPCQLYGSGDTYRLVVPYRKPPFSVSIAGKIRKRGELEATIEPNTLEVKV